MSVWCGKINMICHLAMQNRGRKEENIKIEQFSGFLFIYIIHSPIYVHVILFALDWWD